MVLVNKSGCWQLGLISVLVISEAMISASRNYLLAQMVPDRTLGDESSAIAPNAEVKGLPAELIEGGAARGSNLFHSFAEFNVGELQRVYFANPTGIENILSRVTGSNVSNILGTLGVDGIANLFFLNPNGIIFGENARLDVAGSFVGSTANSFVFPDGSEFSATNPTAPPLLTINLTPGLQYGQNLRGDLVNSGNLTVAPRQTLSLSGQDVTSTGNLTAPGGTVQVLGERVGLLDNAKIDVSEDTGGGNVFVGGNFQGRGPLPNAKRTYIGPNVNINADALTTGNGGRVIVWADEVTGFYGNISARGGSVFGNGGLVEVSGQEQLIFRGHVDTSALNGFPGVLLLDPTNITIADGTGDSGDDGTDSFAGNNSGVAGSILSTPLSEINDTAPTTIYKSELEGLSGDTNVFLQATNNITVNDLADNELNFAAGRGAIAFTADADRDGVGNFEMKDTADTIKTNGRNIGISGASLTVGNIDTSFVLGGETTTVDVDAGGPIPEIGTAIFTFTVPNLGEPINDLDVRFSAAHTFDYDLNVFLTSPEGTDLELFSRLCLFVVCQNFQDTLLDDRAPRSIADGSGDFRFTYRPTGTGGLAVFNGENPAGIWTLTVTDQFRGDSGTLFRAGEAAPWGTAIGTQLLFTSSITGGGDSGSITLNATNGNISAGNLNASSDFGSGGAIALNATGDINLKGDVLSRSRATTSGNAGDINLITTGDITLFNGVSINSSARSGGAGDINLMTNGNVSLTNSSIGSGTSASVKAGDINITAGSLFLTNGGNLSAITVGEGQGGNINVTATESVELTGRSTSGGQSGLFTFTNGAGDSGDITITTNKNLIVRDGAVLSAGAFPSLSGGQAQAGNITVNATESVELSRAGILNQNTGDGDGGDLTIETGRLMLQDSGIVTNAGKGDAGDITLIANDAILLQAIRDGAKVSTSTSGEGNGGNLTVRASRVDLSGSGQFGTGLFTEAETGATGSAGDLTIETNSLSIRDGARASTATLGTGSAGKLTVKASDVVEVIGESANGSGSVLDTLTFGAGDAGDLTITTGRLIVRDGASITSGAFPDSNGKQGQGGDINLTTTESVELSGGVISTQTTGSGNAGDLKINTRRLILLENSAIFAVTAGKGNAGDIALIANDAILLQAIRDGAKVSTSTSGEGNGGNLTVRASRVDLSGSGQFGTGLFTEAETGATGSAGDLTIETNSLSIRDGARASTATLGTGSAGKLTVKASDVVEVIGESANGSGSVLGTLTFGAGDAGDLTITTGRLIVRDGAVVTSGAFPESDGKQGQGGNIIVSADESVELGGIAGIFTNTDGSGDAGDLTIDTNRLFVQDSSSIQAITSGRGNGGNIQIKADDSISVLRGSRIDSFTSGSGRAGNISITSDFVDLSGTKSSFSTSSRTTSSGESGDITVTAESLRVADGAAVEAQTRSTNKGGEITVNANTLEVTSGGQLSTTTFGSGQAGNITLKVPNSVTLKGEGSGLFASTQGESSGDGGSIFIDPETIILQDGASIAVNSQGEGEGGNIELQAGSLSLDGGTITAQTTSNQGGNINLQLLDLLTLRNNSQISATAGTAQAGGDGGNIKIDAPFILNFPGENNNITAEAFLDTGGNININTNRIFGREFLDISASSRFGLEGTVSIDTLELDPSQVLVELPSKPETPQILQGCEVSGGGGSSFINTGRGGLPPSPTETLSSRQVWKDVQLPTQLTKNSANTVKHSNTNNERIVEATGWIINEEGILELVAEKSSDTRQESCR